jgi:hypothetical protein
LHEQAAIPVADPQAFGVVRSAIQTAFSLPKVKDFLKSIERAGLRIRDFELVLNKGILGSSIADQYGRLGNGDQGQIREFYLASLEQVSPELRKKFFKLYSYY